MRECLLALAVIMVTCGLAWIHPGLALAVLGVWLGAIAEQLGDA